MLRVLLQREISLKVASVADWIYPIMFFLIVLVLFPISFGTEKILLQKVAVPAVWIASLLSVLLASQNIFKADIDNGIFEQLIVARTSITSWVMIKLFVHWLTSGFVLVFTSCVVVPLYHLSVSSVLVLMASLMVGTPILVLISALASALTINANTSSVLVPIIAIPLQLPVLIFTIGTLDSFVQGMAILPLFALLTALLILAVLLLPLTIAFTLRLLL